MIEGAATLEESNWRGPTRPIIVPMAQPFRAHAKDLLEVQHYPKRLLWPGGPPEQPYDVTGWTLPLQMGVRVRALPAMPRGARSHDDDRGIDQERADIDRRETHGRVRGARRVLLPTRRKSPSLPAANHYTLTHLPRIAVYRPWTGNMDEGWCRWVLEQFHLPYVSLTDSVAKAGKLRDHFDVLLVPDMSLREMRDGNSPKDFPPPYAGGLGTAGIEAIREFVTNGGTLVLLDHASELATESLGVPVKRIVVPRRLTDETRSRAPDAGESCGAAVRTGLDPASARGYDECSRVRNARYRCRVLHELRDVQCRRRVASTSDRTIPRKGRRHSAEWISAGSITDRGESRRDLRTGWTRARRDVRLSSAAPWSVVWHVPHAVQRLARRWRLRHS